MLNDAMGTMYRESEAAGIIGVAVVTLKRWRLKGKAKHITQDKTVYYSNVEVKRLKALKKP